MSIYFAPALAALIFKLFILAYVLRGGRVSIVFLSLIIIFALHNAIEIFGYFNVQRGDSANVYFLLYYVATVYVILYMLLHGLSVSKLENKMAVTAFVALSTCLSGLILFTDLIIGGQYSIGYSVTAIKGPYYWGFAAYILITLSSGFFATLLGYKNATSQIDSIRCLHSMLALAPMTLVCAIAMIFKMTDVGVNATGLIPIATTLFLVIVLKTESKHKLSDLRRVMPLSPERQTSNNFMDLLDSYIQSGHRSNVYKELQAGIEREIIMYSIKKCDGNITKTAEMMGLKNRSTLYSMMIRLDMNWEELKQQNTD
ncbi:MAG: DNA-binding protein Fis [Arenicella sp.]|jgi:DNA-binding protein Fis